MKRKSDKGLNPSKRSLAFPLTVLLSYVLLLMMSYGFPVLGDDWVFLPALGSKASLLEPFHAGWDTAAQHYITTNGRLLGNFMVKFCSYSKLLRELIRCGIILGICLCVDRLSGDGKQRSAFCYLIGFTLLVAIPARIAAQTYAWSSGFFNYVPPTLLYLLYARYVRGIFCGEGPESSLLRCLGLFLLGLAGSLFMENQTIGFCLLSLGVFAADWIRGKKLRPDLLLCFLGSALGCCLMFCAPGYHMVGEGNYRSLPQDLAALIQVVQENFETLSGYLIRGNSLVIHLLSVCGAALCLRRYPRASRRLRLFLLCSMAVYLCCPVIFYAQDKLFSRYHFLLDFAATLIYFLNLFLTGLLVPEKKTARFPLIFFTLSFVLFLSPLMIVHPLGPRNCYFFAVLLIAMTMNLLRLALGDLTALRPLRAAVCLACCLVLLGNLWVYYRNGRTEQLRNQIVAEAMERGDTSITLPSFPYPIYTHRGNSSAMTWYYYYQSKGDITFEYQSYGDWISTH